MAQRRYVMWNSNGTREVRIQSKSGGRWGSAKILTPGMRGYNKALATAQRVGQGGIVSSGG